MKETDPKYMQVYNQLKKDLYAGKYPAGSLLPTETQLVEMFSVSKSTVRHAIAMLIADKLVKVTQGRGAEVLPITSKPLQYNRYKGHTIVSSGFIPHYAGQALTSSAFFIETIPASGEPCTVLEISEGEPLFKIQYFQMIGSTPFNYLTTYLPCKFTPDLDSRISEAVRLYPFIIKTYGLELTHTKEMITFGSANLIESRLLSVEIGTPLMHTYRTVFSGEKKILYAEASLRADIMTMSLVADSPEYVI